MDSFSEYLVRNKLINDQIGRENQHSFLIITRGYANEDYRWQEAGTRLYYSQYALHARVLSSLVSRLGLSSDSALEMALTAARAANALLIAAVLALFWMRCFFNRYRGAYWLAICLTAISSGLALFAQNLYFALGIFVSAFGLVTWLYGRLCCAQLCLIVGIASTVNFLCRFEFATVFSLLTVLPVLLFCQQKTRIEQLRYSLALFMATVVGFVIAVLWHGWAVAEAVHQPLSDGFQVAFSSLSHRTLSWNNVPYPFSMDAVRLWNRHLNGSAFSLFGLACNKRAVLLLFLVLVVRHLWSRDTKNLLICGWALACYASWYLFAYQHIMFHDMYDWLVFGLSIGLIAIQQVALYATTIPSFPLFRKSARLFSQTKV